MTRGTTREALRSLRALSRALAHSEIRGRAAAMAILLFVFLLTINGLNVVNSYVGRDFMTAIEQQDQRAFVRQALIYAGFFVLLTVVAVLYRFTEERLGLLWREWLTEQLVDRYLRDHVYYDLNVSGTLTNPDQRIADDVRSFTTNTLSLALIFTNGLITIAAFSGVLWSISGTLFLVAVGYAALGSVLTIGFGRPLVRLNYAQADCEANFRAELVHVRENAEHLAMAHRERHMRGRLRQDVEALVQNMRRIIAVNRNLGFFTTGYNYFIQLIPVLVVAPMFIRGEVEFGVISQSSMAFAHLMGAFSLVVTQFPQLSSYAAVVARLGALTYAIDSVATRPSPGVEIVEDERRFAFENVTLRSSHDRRVVVRDLTLELPPRAHVLVRVPTPGTATALQRAVAGVWERGEGRIVRPPLDDVLMLPERPYLPPGTLRELVLGTETRNVSEDELWSVLRRLGLEGTVRRVGGLDVERDWDDVLTVDEQRLIGIARIALAGVRYAMLADVEEAFGSERARRVLDLLAERGIGCVELAEGETERPEAAATIVIALDGSWTQPVAQARVS